MEQYAMVRNGLCGVNQLLRSHLSTIRMSLYFRTLVGDSHAKNHHGQELELFFAIEVPCTRGFMWRTLVPPSATTA
jgi:hypothetical protein